jgi:hypothetical protein
MYFGIFFVVIGFLAAVTAVFAAPVETEVTGVDRVVTVVVGLLAAGGGAYFFLNSPRSQIDVSEDYKTIHINRTGFQLKEQESIRSEDIKDVFIVESDEPQRARAYSLRFLLHDGTEIPLTMNWFRDRQTLEENARYLREIIKR